MVCSINDKKTREAVLCLWGFICQQVCVPVSLKSFRRVVVSIKHCFFSEWLSMKWKLLSYVCM